MDTDDRLELPANKSERLLMLQYDFLKHLTSLSLLSIGGVVTFAGSIFDKVGDKQPLWFATGGLVVAAIMAFSGQLTLLGRLDPSSVSKSGWKKLLLGYWGLGPAPSIAIATAFLALSVGELIAFATKNLG